MICRSIIGWCGLFFLMGGGLLGAQPVDTVITAAVEVARFEAARALAADPSGRLYVVDAGRDAVIQLDAQGRRLAVLGGSGTAEGQFDQPSDIDPTNGLVWVVADAGNNRIQRFSNQALHLESLPVPSGERFAPERSGRRSYGIGDEAGLETADGRPIAVLTSPANETFAIDAVYNHVLKWDARRRLERTIGGFEMGEGALVEPVALALAEDRVFVADRGQATVMVYDLFGGFDRRLGPGLAEEVQALSATKEALWVVLPKRILVFELQGRLSRVLDIQVGEPLVDAVQVGKKTYLLTARRLLQY